MKSLLVVASLVVTCAVAAPAGATNHPVGGPRSRPAEAPSKAASEPAAPRSKRAALEVNGIPVSLKTYRRVVREGEASWNFLLDMFPLSKLTKGGRTKQEFLFLHEHAEPLLMRARHADEIAELEEMANECHRRAVAGEDMTLLVLKYSSDPNVHATKGETKLMGFSDALHPLNRLAWQADIGEVLPPVQTVRGYHVAKVVQIVPAHEQPRSDGSGSDRIPELRRLRQAMFLFNTRHAEDDPGFAVLRREILALPNEIEITVLDDRLCKDLPNWCAARPGAWTKPPDDADDALVGLPAPTPQ